MQDSLELVRVKIWPLFHTHLTIAVEVQTWLWFRRKTASRREMGKGGKAPRGRKQVLGIRKFSREFQKE